MTPFIFNIVLAVVWTALTGRLDLGNFALGFALGAVAIALSRGLWGGTAYFQRAGRVAGLLGWSLVEFVAAGVFEALEAFAWRRRATIETEIPISLKQGGQIALFSSLISLSPGTLVVGIDRGRSRLIVETAPGRAGLLTGRVAPMLERQIKGLSQ
ncbi:MAG: Na+/H+ antiporter subunit E [Alphaproteobacteria bacterium]